MTKTVMAVGNETRLISLIKAYLISSGFRIISTPGRSESLLALASDETDLIVLDLANSNEEGCKFIQECNVEQGVSMALLAVRDDAIPELKAGMMLLHVADIALDRDSRTVRVAGRYVNLTPSEFELLETMMSAPGRAFSRRELHDILNGASSEGSRRAIDLHIKNLRAKIEPDRRSPRYIETVYGAGYRFSRQ